MTRIVVFGDSISWGHSDSTSGGWVELLRRYFLKSNLDISLYNLSISADTTKDILNRFDVEAKARNPDYIIFAIGVNDCLYNRDENYVQVNSKKFKKNLDVLLKKSEKYSKKIGFIGLFRCDELKTNPVSWDNTVYYNNDLIFSYNEMLKEFCIDNNLFYIDIIDDLKIEDLDDGLHPNSKGHKKIYEKVKDFLLENVLF